MLETDALVDAGLTNAEARVYLALLELGSTTAGPVIKKAGLHRGTTYQVLQRLLEKGHQSLLADLLKPKTLKSPPTTLSFLKIFI